MESNPVLRIFYFLMLVMSLSIGQRAIAEGIPSDINSDGIVNEKDLLILQKHWHEGVEYTPTFSPTSTPTSTDTPTDSPTYLPTDTASSTPSDTPTLPPTDTPSLTPTETPSPTPSYSPTETASHTPSHSPTDTASHTPSYSPTETSSHTPSHTPTRIPSNTPTRTPSVTPTRTDTPTVTPSETPTETPSVTPTETPSDTPTEVVESTTVIHVAWDAEGDGSGSDWENGCRSLTAGLTFSATGDEIWVKAGRYIESITMTAGVDIYGGFKGTESFLEERNWISNETIIDATGLNQSVVLGADNAILDGFTITGGNGVDGGGVKCWITSPTLLNLIIIGNAASHHGGGVYCQKESYPLLINCTIKDNTASWRGGGVRSQYGAAPEMHNCVVLGNVAFDTGGGIDCDRSSPILKHCSIIGNKAYNGCGGLRSYSESFPVLTNCILWNTGEEITTYLTDSPLITYSCIQGGWGGEGNIDANPMFMSMEQGDVRLQDGSPCIDRGVVTGSLIKDIEGNSRPGSDGKVDMGAYESADQCEPGSPDYNPQVLRVSADAPTGGDGLSWETAFTNISAALAICGTSDEIWVSQGRYDETVAMEPAVALYGGFSATESLRTERDRLSHETVIDAKGLNTHAVIGAITATLDGFTITGGNAKDGGGIYCLSSPCLQNLIVERNEASRYGGGMYCIASSPRISDSTFANNVAFNDAGGIFVDHNSSPLLTTCSILQNSGPRGGGLACRYSATPTLEKCLIANNEATLDYGSVGGGGVRIWDAYAVLNGCTIEGNKSAENGGGIYCTSSGTVMISSCTIKNNSADRAGGGVYFYGGSSATIARSTIIGNSAGWSGGGVWLSTDCQSDLANCEIVGNNIGTGSGGGIACWGAEATVSNCTITGNPGYGIWCTSGGSAVGKNCILWNPGPETSGSVSLTYSCVENGYSGTGNISSTPGFILPWNGSDADVHLLSTSPCIDSGGSITDVTDDIDGDARPYKAVTWETRGDGSGYDMGADEYMGSIPQSDM